MANRSPGLKRASDSVVLWLTPFVLADAGETGAEGGQGQWIWATEEVARILAEAVVHGFVSDVFFVGTIFLAVCVTSPTT